MSPIIVGHRGVAGTHPENTGASVKQAAALGLQWIEIDIQITQDNQLVVCHDHTLERCSDGSGRVDNLTLAELRRLDFGTWKSEDFAGEGILTLSELLALTDELSLNVNIEIKVDSKHQPEHVVGLLKSELTRLNVDTDKVILSSFSHSVMEHLAKHLGKYRLGVITDQLTQEDLTLLTSIDAYSCHINHQALSESGLTTLRKLEVEVWCYTVNKPEEFPLLNQVNAIFTDYPSRFC